MLKITFPTSAKFQLRIFDTTLESENSEVLHMFEPISNFKIKYLRNKKWVEFGTVRTVVVKNDFEAEKAIESWILECFIHIRDNRFNTISIEKLLDLAKIKEIIE